MTPKADKQGSDYEQLKKQMRGCIEFGNVPARLSILTPALEAIEALERALAVYVKADHEGAASLAVDLANAERQLAEARAREERKDEALELAIKEACPHCAEGDPTDKTWEHGNKDGVDRKGLYHPHKNLSGHFGGGYIKCRAWKAREALAAPAPEPSEEHAAAVAQMQQALGSYDTKTVLGPPRELSPEESASPPHHPEKTNDG